MPKSRALSLTFADLPSEEVVDLSMLMQHRTDAGTVTVPRSR